MTDKLIRELLIDVKQKGATRTAKSIENVSDALENAAAASELTNEQLSKMPKTLYSIERAADRAAKSLTNMQASRGMLGITKSIDSIGAKLDDLAIAMIEVADKLEAGFSGVSRSVKATGNDVAAATEKVQDRLYDTNRVLVSTTKGFNDTTASAGRASRAIGNTSGSARGATRDFAAMAKVGGGLPILYAAFASNIFVLQSALDNLKMGDQLNRLERFGSIVGSMTGTPVQSLAVSLQEAVNGAISFQEAMQQASVASTYGFTTEQIEQFGLVARRASAVLGIDMVDALNRVIKGVSKQEIELLDELGITIRLNDAYEKYVQVLNSANTGITYNINTLNTYQKQQATANAAIEDSTKKLGQLDSALRTTSWETFAANANAALRAVQMYGASFLDPVIDRMNTIMNRAPVLTRIAESNAAIKSIDQMDTNNVGALLNAYNNAFDRTKKLATETMQTMQQIRSNEAAIDKIYAKRRAMEGQTAKSLGLSWQAYREQISALIREEDSLVQQNNRLKENAEENSKNALAFAKEQDAATNKLQQNQTLWNSIVDASGKVDANKLAAALDAANATAASIKNDIPAINGYLGDQSSILKNSEKIATDLAGVISTVRNNAAATGRTEDQVLETYGLQYKTMKDLEAAQKSFSEASKATKDNSEDALAVQQKIADVYASTKDREAAQAAGRALEIAQLDSQIARLKELKNLGIGTTQIQDEINKLQTQRLSLINQGMEGQKKVKDYTDKILGVDREIALLNDRTMTSTQYRLEQLKLELQLEKEKTELYSKQADGQAKVEQSRRAQAQLEREKWEAENQATASHVSALMDALEVSQTQRNVTGQSQILTERLSILQQQLELSKGNTEEEIRYRNEIYKTSAALEQLKKQREDQTYKSVVSSLGGTFTPTYGLSGADKEFADFENRMSMYDQAIAKMSEVDSASTALANSIGNFSLAVVANAQDSLDSITTISAGMQMVGQMMAYSANQQISAIDQAIAAEQKRDGKSEESKAKIKKLEAEKTKIQQREAKKQIIISTAVAMMNAAATQPFLPLGLTMMATAAAAGALSLAAASNASSMPSVDSGANTTSYLTLGERQKSIDVSMSANAGELSYVRGEKGIGNANSFVPRAEGGNMYPGVSYQMGEHGTEVITPMVPMKATPNDELKNSSNSTSGRPIILNISAMDAASFREFASSNSGALRDAVELALNENGASLKTLGNS